MALRAPIFDFDGPILDTETPEIEAWKGVFAEYDSPFPEAAYVGAIDASASGIERIREFRRYPDAANPRVRPDRIRRRQGLCDCGDNERTIQNED